MTLNIRNTFIALIILNTLNTLNPLFIIVSDGRIDIKSIIAMNDKGYFINEVQFLLLNL